MKSEKVRRRPLQSLPLEGKVATELTDEVSNEVEVNTSSTASGPPSPQGEGYGGPSGTPVPTGRYMRNGSV